MSLLTICQDIAESVGLVAPSTIIGNTNQDAIRLKAAVNEAGKRLYMKGWPELQPLTTISTSSGQADYALPSDFRGVVPETMWNTSNNDPVNGAITPRRYDSLINGIANIAVYDEFALLASGSAGQLHIQPTPTAVEVVVYRYQRTTWISGSGGSAFSSWVTSAGDAAVPFFDEHAVYLEAKWRFLKSIGQPFALEKQEAGDYCDTTLAHAIGAHTLYAGTRGKQPWVMAVTPDTSVGLP